MVLSIKVLMYQTVEDNLCCITQNPKILVAHNKIGLSYCMSIMNQLGLCIMSLAPGCKLTDLYLGHCWSRGREERNMLSLWNFCYFIEQVTWPFLDISRRLSITVPWIRVPQGETTQRGIMALLISFIIYQSRYYLILFFRLGYELKKVK